MHADEIAEIAEYVSTCLPALKTHHRAVTCMYTLTPDGHFLLGVHPQHAQVVVAAGFSGHGFKFTPVIGEILADLVLTSTTTHDISLFDPARPHLEASPIEETLEHGGLENGTTDQDP